MGGLEALLPAFGNLGGMGLLSWALFVLHRDALRSFRDELSAERTMWAGQIDHERVERHNSVLDLRRERQIQHAEIIEQLGRMEEDLRRLREGLLNCDC